MIERHPHTNGTVRAGSEAPSEAPPIPPRPVRPLPPERPFERHLRFIVSQRRRLLVMAALAIGWVALVTWTVDPHDGWTLLTCFVGGAVGGWCIGLRTGLGDSRRTLEFVVRLLRSRGPDRDG